MQARNRVSPVYLGVGVGVLMMVGCGLSPDEQQSEQETNPINLNSELWATSQKDGVEFIINKSGQVTDMISLPGAGPHITTFPASGAFAYVGGMLDGKLYVIDAHTHDVVTTLQVGPTLAHQAKPSPLGTSLLVTVLSTQSVVKVLAVELTRTWTIVGSASTAQFGKPPICTVWRNDGLRAYVSMNPSGIAVLDTLTMTFLNELPTDGFVACGMIKQTNGRFVTVASSGGGGHIYTLDTLNDTLTDRGTLGAPSWHSFITSKDGRLGFGTSPLSDQVIAVDLQTNPVTNLGAITFASGPATNDDQPDAVGGGEMIQGKTLAVSLRAAGKIGFIDVQSRSILGYLHLSNPAPFNPATCQDCAVHGVTIR
jgi:DNA-binding beta-propeller fold protein YncE